MTIEPGSAKADIIFRALQLLSIENTRLLNDETEDLATDYRNRLLEEQIIIEQLAAPAHTHHRRENP